MGSVEKCSVTSLISGFVFNFQIVWTFRSDAGPEADSPVRALLEVLKVTSLLNHD